MTFAVQSGLESDGLAERAGDTLESQGAVGGVFRGVGGQGPVVQGFAQAEAELGEPRQAGRVPLHHPRRVMHEQNKNTWAGICQGSSASGNDSKIVLWLNYRHLQSAGESVRGGVMNFRNCKTLALLLGMLVGTTANAATTPEEDAALRRASERGDLIYNLDQAAWVSTDEMLRKIPDPHAAGIVGWIVEPAGDRMHVIYYSLKRGQPIAGFVVETRRREIISSHLVADGEDATLTPTELRMVMARQVALKQSRAPCTEGGMNTVVLPPLGPNEPVPVYVLSSQVRDGEYPFGGHYEFDISPQGKVILSRTFSRSCLNVAAPPAGPDKKTEALYVTHLLDTTPTEIHVFTSQASGLPVYVGTPLSLPATPKEHRTWRVDGRTISLLTE